MRDFNDLSREEVSSLTEDQIQVYKDYAIASAGLIPVKRPKDIVAQPRPEGDMTVYHCRGLLFTDQKEAQVVANLHSVVTKQYNNNSLKVVARDEKYSEENNVVITSEKMFSNKVYNEVSVEAATIAQAEKTYKEHLSEYDRYIITRNDETIFINQIITGVANESYYIASCRERYSELSKLSEGNKDIIDNFFRAAYKKGIVEDKLSSFYEEYSTYSIKAYTYEEFLNLFDVVLIEEVKGK